MPDDVRQCLLENPEQRRTELLFQRGLSTKIVPHIAPNPRAVLKIIRLPLQRGYQAEMIKHARPQLGRDAADGLDSGVNVRR
jgi:hypothetical protein